MIQQMFSLLNIHHDAYRLVHWLENIDYRIYNLLNVEIMSIFIDLVMLFIFVSYFCFVKGHYCSSILFTFLFFLSFYFYENVTLISRNDNLLNERINSIKSYISAYFISSSIIGSFALYIKYSNIKKSLKISSKIASKMMNDSLVRLGFKILLMLIGLVIILYGYPTIYPHGNHRLRMRYVGILELSLNFSMTVALPVSIYIILIIWGIN